MVLGRPAKNFMQEPATGGPGAGRGSAPPPPPQMLALPISTWLSSQWLMMWRCF